MDRNSHQNYLIKTFIEDFHQLMIKNGFKFEDNRIDSTGGRIQTVYKFKSSKFKDKLTVVLICVPLMSFVIECIAYVPLLLVKESPLNCVNAISIGFNWIKETKQMIVKRFEEFIKKLTEILSIGINDLPQELLLKIVNYLPFKSVVQLSQTNSFWRRFCNEESIWRNFYRQNYSLNPFNEVFISKNSWKQAFIREYLWDIQRRERFKIFEFPRMSESFQRPESPQMPKRVRLSETFQKSKSIRISESHPMSERTRISESFRLSERTGTSETFRMQYTPRMP
jgi:hypothetical protein